MFNKNNLCLCIFLVCCISHNSAANELTFTSSDSSINSSVEKSIDGSVEKSIDGSVEKSVDKSVDSSAENTDEGAVKSKVNSLDKLKSVLNGLSGTTPITAEFESSYSASSGKKKRQKTTTGFAKIKLIDSDSGLQLLYSNQTLLQSEDEANQKENDEEINTPTLNVINGIRAPEMRSMLSASSNILRTLNKAKLLNEASVEYQGKAARQLFFQLPLEAIIDNQDIRDYVDNFNSEFSITIDEQGIPLQSKLTFEGNGTAFIIFSLKASQTSVSTYRIFGDRLVNIKQEYTRKQKSTWGINNSSGTKLLTITTDPDSIASIAKPF